MEAFSFSCPHCSAVLRLRDRTFVGRQVDCPDCGNSLALALDERNCVVVQRPQTQAADRTGVATALGAVLKVPAKHSSQMAVWLAPLKSPVGVAWMVAVVCTAALILAVVWSESERPVPTVSPVDSLTAHDPQQQLSEPRQAQPSEDVDAQPPHGARETKRPQAIDALIETQLTGLGERLEHYYAKHGRFPEARIENAHVAAEHQFSWLAALAADFDRFQNAQPLWDRSWTDPLNDRFVRRRIREFHNPAVPTLVTANGYPATHFVGVSGVGANAAYLDITDPRAGVFGFNRRTRLEDISDGTSNTMMIAGVQENLGAWAASGHATLRAFTRTPYINGPDGFGTGQADGMYVLKADGSVQFLSAKIEPTILRRLAAMADGLPLDLSVPGEPGGGLPNIAATVGNPPEAADPIQAADATVVAQNENDDQQVAAEVDEPGLAPAGPPEPAKPAGAQTIDVEAALRQKIVSFAQIQPCPLAQLLSQLEEMSGVPIELDEQNIDAALLEQPLTLTLRDTTLGDLLRALVLRAGLIYEIRDGRIQIRQLGPEDGEPDRVSDVSGGGKG